MQFRYEGKEWKTDVRDWVTDIAEDDTPCYLFESEADSISFVTYKWVTDETEDQGGSRKTEKKARKKGKETEKKKKK